MSTKAQILLLTALMIYSSICLSEDQSALQLDANGLAESDQIPGIALATGSCDSSYSAVSGVIKLGTAIKVTQESKFNLGSNSKSILATAAAVAEQNKQIVINKAQYGDYKATLENYLTHTSGLPAFSSGKELNQVDIPHNTKNKAKYFATFVMTKADESKIGTMLYSNAGYVVAGQILNETLHKPWYSVINTSLFGPLDIEASLGDGQSEIDAIGHYTDGGLKPYELNEPAIPEYLEAAGNISMSINDYSKYLKFHLCGLTGKDSSILSSKKVQMLHKPYQETGSAMGWGVSEIEGHQTSFHIGGTGTFISVAAIVPSKNYFNIILINNGSGEAKSLAVSWVLQQIKNL
ncbi:MAG: beta-lactamase family protein [Gammaproteobacteria bacterium]|nr:beta-lactamase family protein [Gammaproteobacteria bacterium]